MENSYAETLSGLIARLPETVQVPPHLTTDDGETCSPHVLRRFARKTVRAELDFGPFLEGEDA